MKSKKKSTKSKEDQSKEVGHVFDDLMKPKEMIETVKQKKGYKVIEQGLTISIDKLPDCAHKEKLINEVSNKDTKICVVASLNEQLNKWTCYAGYPDIREVKPLNGTEVYTTQKMDFEWCCVNIRDREQVLFMGDVLKEEEARILFPEWKDVEYRK